MEAVSKLQRDSLFFVFWWLSAQQSKPPPGAYVCHFDKLSDRE